MRRMVTHAPALLVTFSCGLLLALLWALVVGNYVRRHVLAGRWAGAS